MLESIEFPEPVIQLAIEPKTKADQEKLGMAIQKLVQEDPTLRVSTDPETGQTILAGMGELHLEIIVDRMQREFGVGANVGKPQVAYRETIRDAAEADYTHIEADRAAAASTAHVKLRIEPQPGQGLRVRKRRSSAASIPKEYIPAVEKGVAEALEGGVLAGYPMSDIKVTLFDGAYHEVDSSEMAFKICRFHVREGSRAQGEAGSAGAGDARGSGGSGRVHGLGQRRSDLPPRPPGRHGDPRYDADHQGDGAAVGNVRLRD